MQQFSKEKVEKIWQRVQQSNGPVSQQPDYCASMARELNTAAIYAHLSRRIPGKTGRMLGQFARREQAHAASIKGICAIRYGKCPPMPGVPVEKAPVDILLRRCYGQKQQAIAEYEKLAQQEEYGNIFRQLAREEQEQLLFLLRLLGSIENRPSL